MIKQLINNWGLKCFALSMVLVMFLSSFVGAVPEVDPYYLVHDLAGLLSDAEVDDLEELLNDLSIYYGLEFVFVTTDDAEGLSSMEYADDFFDYNYGYGSGESGVLCLVDMDNRQIWISTTGIGITYLNDADIEYILDEVYPYLVDGDYGDVGFKFAEATEDCIVDYLHNQAITEAAQEKVASLRTDLNKSSGSIIDLSGKLPTSRISDLNRQYQELYDNYHFSVSAVLVIDDVALYIPEYEMRNMVMQRNYETSQRVSQGDDAVKIYITFNQQKSTFGVYSQADDYSLLKSDSGYASQLNAAYESQGDPLKALEAFMPELTKDAQNYHDKYNDTFYQITSSISLFFSKANTHLLTALGGGAVCAFIAAVVTFSKHKSSLPGQASVMTYIGDNLVLTREVDSFVSTNTVQTVKPKNNSSSSSSGGSSSTSSHSSSSGSSHGGGGRSF